MNRPPWIRAKAPSGPDYEDVRRLVESQHLHTVCQSANCPNIGECWRERTATFMILGNTCTRNCRFCAVPKDGPGYHTPDHLSVRRSGISYPGPSLGLDEDEPRRVADAVAHLKLRHAVITSVTRDDLPDGGAHIFAETIRRIHERLPDCSVEVLIPDFQGDESALATVLAAHPQILNHNIETVQRLYPLVRPQAVYSRSIDLLRRASKAGVRTKSGLMVGLGETWEEVIETMRDLRAAGCDILTIGQYLAPSIDHAPIARYYTPDEFQRLRTIGLDLGFGYVESGPLVRSSYHAAEQTSQPKPT